MKLKLQRRALLIIILAGCAIVLPAGATTYRWIDTAGGVWSDPTNWFHQLAPPVGGAADAILTFPDSADSLFKATNDLAGVFSVNQLAFANSAEGSFTVTSNSGSSLSFTGANPQINVTGTGLNILSGSVALDADLTVNMGLGAFQETSFISGTHGITVNGDETAAALGQCILSGDNTFTGGVTLQSGNLVLDGNSFTDPAGTGTLTINGGYLAALPATYLETPLAINSDFRFFGDEFTYFVIQGPITVNDPSANFIFGGGHILLETPLDIQGQIIMGGSPNYLPGTGEAGMSLATNPTTGTSGTLLHASSISLLGGAYLIISNSSDTISDTAPISMRTGFISLNGAAEGTTEVIGSVNLSGYSSLVANPGSNQGQGQPAVLNPASLTRVDHGVLYVSGQRLGDASVTKHGAIVATAGGPTLIGGGGPPGSTTISIVPWAVAFYSLQTETEPPNSFATYDAVNGFRPLAPTEFASALGTDPTQNVSIAASTTNNGAMMVNSLAFGGNSKITLGGTGNIAITSGAFLYKGADDSAISNSLSFGAAEGVITSAAQFVQFNLLTINGNLTGNSGLTLVGPLALAGNNSGLTGPLTLNGFLEITSTNNLPGTGAITAYSDIYASAGFGIGGTINVDRDLILASGKVGLETLTDDSAATFSGTISGPASLDINPGESSSSGIVELAGTNTYTGSTTVDNGTLIIHSDANLGNGGALTIGTTLLLAGDWTTSRLVYLPYTISAIDTGGHSAVLNNIVSGGGNLIKQGEGTLTLNQPFIYTGGGSNPFVNSEVDAGTLVINNHHAGSVYVNAGTLGGSGTIAAFVIVGNGNNPGAVLAPAAGGNQPRTLTIEEPLTFTTHTTYTWFLKARANQRKADKVSAQGVTINGGNFVVRGQIQGTLAAGTVFTAINNISGRPIDGTFSNLPEGGIVTVNGTNLQASYKGGNGNDLTLTVVP